MCVVYCNTYVYSESPNKGHFRAALFVLCKEVVLFEEVEMYYNYREKYFWTSNCVLCGEGILISECPLSDISLYAYIRMES